MEMIYSRFGTKLTMLSKDIDGSGQVRIQAKAEGTDEVRDYGYLDLKADDGRTEIDAAIATLPAKKPPTASTRPRPRRF